FHLANVIVIGGYGPGPNVGSASYLRVTDIAQVGNVCLWPDRTLFDLHEVSDAHLIAQHNTVAQMGKRTDPTVGTDCRIGNHRLRNRGVTPDGYRTLNDSVRTNHTVRSDFNGSGYKAAGQHSGLTINICLRRNPGGERINNG